MEEQLFYRTDILYTGNFTNKILSNRYTIYGDTVISYTIYGYTGEQVHGRTGTWAKRYMAERVHDHTLHYKRAHGRTGTRAKRYSIEQVG